MLEPLIILNDARVSATSNENEIFAAFAWQILWNAYCHIKGWSIATPIPESLYSGLSGTRDAERFLAAARARETAATA